MSETKAQSYVNKQLSVMQGKLDQKDQQVKALKKLIEEKNKIISSQKERIEILAPKTK
jgi:hypothetical protein